MCRPSISLSLSHACICAAKMIDAIIGAAVEERTYRNGAVNLYICIADIYRGGCILVNLEFSLSTRFMILQKFDIVFTIYNNYIMKNCQNWIFELYPRREIGIVQRYNLRFCDD